MTDIIVNDVHSQLNTTRVSSIVTPLDVEALQRVVCDTSAADQSIAIAGGRHAMGGQQFGERSVLVDMRSLNHVLGFDPINGRVTVEGGILWPDLLSFLIRAQRDDEHQWGIYQKQTGADRLSIGGALSCNCHGRGLTLKPIVDQVCSFDLMTARGEVVTCSRDENYDLFRLAVGGYGLFGLITRVELQLRRRVKVRRVVTLGDTESIAERFEERIRDGYLYGDYQFATDSTRKSFLARGVFSCYAPVAPDVPLTANPTRFSQEDWARLTLYSHTHKKLAFDVYSSRYLRTSGQVYWGDDQLSAAYVDNYHADIDRATGARVRGTEMITEIYVQRPVLGHFMAAARDLFRRRQADIIYGTVRMIERDEETFLTWARDRYACIVFNLHVDHTPEAIDEAADTFRALIDLGIAHGGSYYLTYHRWARQDQIEQCYPQMRDFLELKLHHDPHEVFQTTWYRHYRDMLGIRRHLAA